jgi:NADP-dependent 3-hydroxy acid dehydrogenase YdfG
MGLAHLTAAFVPSMGERGRGGVLNIGSGAGLTVMPASGAYGASKHFVDGFSECLRAELTGTGVAVTQVFPGPGGQRVRRHGRQYGRHDRRPAAAPANQRSYLRQGGDRRLGARRRILVVIDSGEALRSAVLELA